jgi:hypothetical protein
MIPSEMRCGSSCRTKGAGIFGGSTFVFAKGGKRGYSDDVDGGLRVWDLD